MFALCLSAVLAWAGPAPAFTVWLPPQTLTATDSKAPVVAVAPDGTTVIAWSRVSGATSVVEAVRRRPGQGYGPPVQLGSDASNPRVGMDAAGNATVAWEEQDVGVRAARLPAATGFEAASTVVPGGSGVELAVGAGGTAVVLAPVGGVLQAAVRAGASGAFAAAAPISAGAVGDPDVAVGADGHAVAAWVEGERVRANERPAGGSFAAAGTIRSPDDDAFTVDEPAAAIGGDGRAVVVWTQDLESDATGSYIATSFEPGAWSSAASPPSRAAELVTAPDGRIVGAWARDAFLEVAELPAGAELFTNNGVSASTPATAARPAVAVGADGTTVAAWAGGTAVHAARRAAGTNVLFTANLAAGAGAGDPSVGGDDQGNATAAWLSPGRRVTVASFDNAAPVLSAVTVPASARAGGPAVGMSAAAFDRIGPVTLRLDLRGRRERDRRRRRARVRRRRCVRRHRRRGGRRRQPRRRGAPRHRRARREAAPGGRRRSRASPRACSSAGACAGSGSSSSGCGSPACPRVRRPSCAARASAARSGAPASSRPASAARSTSSSRSTSISGASGRGSGSTCGSRRPATSGRCCASTSSAARSRKALQRCMPIGAASIRRSC